MFKRYNFLPSAVPDAETLAREADDNSFGSKPRPTKAFSRDKVYKPEFTP